MESCETKISFLRKRSEFLFQIRCFFREKGVYEVETSAISQYAVVDRHIECFQIGESPPRFLIPSPEYHMKRLLAAGSGSIFQLGKAFRKGECGSLHSPEFTLLEWYRVGWNHFQLMREVEEIIVSVFHFPPVKYRTWRDTFYNFLGFDPYDMTRQQFWNLCLSRGNQPPTSMRSSEIPLEECYDYILAMFIEPQLGQEQPEFVTGFPRCQSLLAKFDPEDSHAASRFELYYQGIELGNGFHELNDYQEQKKRFELENQKRQKAGKKMIELDHYFLEALEKGMPDCSGVALGIDRLTMLALNASSIKEIQAFTWEQ